MKNKNADRNSSAKISKTATLQNGKAEEREKLYRTILHSIDEAVITTDARGRVMQMNPMAEELTGWSEAEAMGLPSETVFRIVEEGTRNDLESSIIRILKDKKQNMLEKPALLIARSGEEYPIMDRGSPIVDTSGEVIGAVVVFRDRTGEREMEEALRERVKELGCLQSLADIIESEGSDLARVMERTVKILPGSWLHTDIAVARIGIDENSWQTGDMSRCEAIQQADIRVGGEIRGSIEVGYLEERMDRDEGPFIKEERNLINVLSERLGRVTERLKAEEAFRRERKTSQAILDGLDDVIYIADPESYELLLVNETFMKNWGKDWQGKKCHKVLQDRDEPCPFCTNKYIFGDNAGKAHVREFRNEVTKHWFRCSDKAVTWIDGRQVRFELAADITALKEMEESLRQSEERFKTIADVSPDMIYRMTVPEGKYEYVSPASKKLFGYGPKEFLDNPKLIRKVIHPDWHDYFLEEWKKLTEGSATPVYEYQIVRKDNAVRWMNQRNVLIKDENGRPEAMWRIVTDVTENKNAQSALEKSERVLQIHKADLEKTVQERTAELQRQTRVTEAINRIFREALTLETEEEVAKSALAVAEELTNSKFGFIGFVNDEGLFDTIGLSNPGWVACDLPESSAPMLIKGMTIRGIWGKVIKTGESRISNDPNSESDKVGTPKGHPSLTSFLGVPLKRDSHTVGMIALGNKKGGFIDEDQEAIEALSAVFHETLIRKRMENRLREQADLETGQNELSSRIMGINSINDLCRQIITFVCNRLKIPAGIIYLPAKDGNYTQMAGHAFKPDEHDPVKFAPGEGLVGQAAAERNEIALNDVPEDYFTIESGLGKRVPRHLYVLPVVYNDRVEAVLELGALEELDDTNRSFISTISKTLAVSLMSARIREQETELLEETQRQSEELQAQQEELNAANEEFAEQNQRLKDSEDKLRTQQEELQVTNEELEEKTELLERQKREVERKREKISSKAKELAQASRYKSEFLSNMSHELRTPLNSLLLLARGLSENREGNLTKEQIKSAHVIHEGGNELLSLINDILDLSKIEAGRMDLFPMDLIVKDLAEAVESGMRHMAELKGLDFQVSVEESAPQRIHTDRKRLQQIIKNLAGNAIKFTNEGGVNISFFRPDHKTDPQPETLRPGEVIGISVADTGIGIAPEHQDGIFDVFRQVDGSSARRYGGTGLGLSITRELVQLLGGEIHLSSRLDKGSAFAVFIPEKLPGFPPVEDPAKKDGTATAIPDPFDAAENTKAVPIKSTIPDDRDIIKKGDSSILIIEDDSKFAEIVAGHCLERKHKILAAGTGEEGIDLARKFLPRGIVLDVKLPGIDGWRVLEILKEDPETRHIPVHLMSVDEPSDQAMLKGAIGYVQKPVDMEQITSAIAKMEKITSQRDKRVLVVEDDEQTRRAISNLVADDHVRVDEVDNGEKTIAALKANTYDCMILDLGLSDYDGGELLKRIERDEDIRLPPVIVYTGRELTWEENVELRSFSDSIVIKDARSDERLLDEVSLFLHRIVAEMPEKKRQVIENLHDTDALLRNRKVLLVDDDMRALFALTRLLSERGMQVVKAENGKKALEALREHSDFDIVLMDIMMPVLDGYETMKRIRAQDRFKKLPILALTAKAMKGDREQCIKAGASDYLPKPVDADRLISMMRVWLYR